MKPARLAENSRLAWLVLTGVLAVLSIPDCQADPETPAATALPPYVATSVINGNALQNTRGAMAVNQAAGDANLQANSTAIATGELAALAQVHQVQIAGPRLANAPDAAMAAIGDSAFRNAHGVLSINQVSGTGNAQANGVAIAVSSGVVIAESLSESTLATTTAGLPETTETAPGLRSATITESAFVGARGLVQVNQTAGSGNATANNFALSVTLGAKP